MPERVNEWFDPVVDGAEVVAVQISAVDGVEESIKAYAIDKIRHVAEKVSGPVLYASVALRHLDNPAAVRPALADALLDVNGRAVRAHGAAATFTEAIDDAADRLERRVRSQPPWSRSEHVAATPGEWRHENLASPESWQERPTEERQVVQHMTTAERPLSIDEALFDMNARDHDFYLFTDLATGHDAVIERTDDGTLQLTTLGETQTEAPAACSSLVVSGLVPPTLTVDAAREWLDETGSPWLFFADAATRRGAVIYRRYDGHYGHVTARRADDRGEVDVP